MSETKGNYVTSQTASRYEVVLDAIQDARASLQETARLVLQTPTGQSMNQEYFKRLADARTIISRLMMEQS